MVTANTRESVKTRVYGIAGTFPFFSGERSVGDSQIDEAITQAVNRFSRDRPRVTTEDVVGDSGKYYVLSTLLSNWETDFSRVISIDYDANTRISSDESTQFLVRDDDEWKIYRGPDSSNLPVYYLYFPLRTPSSTTTLRVTYSIRHTFSAALSTIPAHYEDAIVNLAVSRLMRIVQIHVEKALDSPMGAQFATFRNKGAGFQALVDAFQQYYIEELGGEEVPAASAIREFDLKFMRYDEQYIFHHGSQR